jgi:hypothetical protein
MWVCFFTVAAAELSIQKPLGAALVMVGAFAPSLAALWVTAREQGGVGVRALLRPILRWRVGPRWYVFAVAYIVVIKLTAAVILRFSTGAWPRFGTTPWLVMLAGVLISTPFQAGEEVGWRGRVCCWE